MDAYAPMADATAAPLPLAALPEARTNLVGLDREELIAAMATIGAPKFRANQLWQWIYNKGAT